MNFMGAIADTLTEAGHNVVSHGLKLKRFKIMFPLHLKQFYMLLLLECSSRRFPLGVSKEYNQAQSKALKRFEQLIASYL